MLRDLDKETVDYYPTFDDTSMQPCVLPARFPNLLVNGSDGIAVGMATNIPPHNLAEVIGAVIAQIDNPEITIDELMEYVPIIHRFLIQIAQHFRREFGHSRLGITHCRGRIAVDGTEVSVPVYQGKIDGEILCKPHERVVHG